MDGQNITGVYHPREPKTSPLWHLLNDHFETFEQDYDEKFVREYGFYRQVISDVVRGYLKCGDLTEGFARVRCPDCHHGYLLAFSCRGRWFCPSCHAKKVVQLGQHLRDNLLYPVPHRQYVFSIPGREALSQYIIRNTFAVSKITYNEESGTVIYRSKMQHRKSKGGKKNFQVFKAEEFIVAITQHIPEKSFQLVRYYGWYSNRARGDREKQKQQNKPVIKESSIFEIIDVSDYRPKRIPSPKWRECIKKVWEVDPLLCPKCGSEMRIISFITGNKVIRKILEHLELWEERQPVERAPPMIKERRYEPIDDGWPSYEESAISVN
ncbi:MAG: transposase zinc-binding domain-containing protein [Proteobacteria bacterium]|nr:transposase zinc-binding domain-containing protein [Pseudomonadota bacterium]MBU1715538.1 transposase zinc-binding domain-containing protein [Pseudomonadota bacterium]